MREREVYRLRYPLLGRPRARLRAGLDEFGGSVLDLSEAGLLVELEAAPAWETDDRIDGQVWLAQGHAAEFRAQVLRRRLREVAVLFEPDSRLPLAIVIEEQRVIRARFPQWR
jgi:hypothetical protein